MDSEKSPSSISPDPTAEAEGLLGTLLSAAVDAIIVINSNGVVQLFNPGAERIFGWNAEDVIGRNVSCLMPNRHATHHDGYIRHFEDTGEARIIGVGRQVTAVNKDGDEFPVDLSVGEARINAHQLYVGIVRDLRERVYLEDRLRQERRQAERVLDLVEVVIAGIDVEGRVQLVNRKGKLFFAGLSGPVGRDWVDECVAPRDRTRVRAFFEGLVNRKDSAIARAEYAMTSGGSTEHEFAWQHQFVPPQGDHDQALILVSGFDITDIHRMAGLLKEREERLRLLFEQAPLGIITADIHGRIESVNQALCASLGTNGAELIGTRMIDLVNDASRDVMTAALQQVTESGLAQRQIKCGLGWAGHTMRGEFSVGLFRSAGNAQAGLVFQIEDKTAQLAAEAEVDQLRDRLAHSHRLGIMGEMAAGIAHEINQPLGAISAYADAAGRFITQEPPKLEQVEFALGQIGEQARRAGEVVRRMRNMAKTGSGGKEKQNINQIVKDLVHLANLEAKHLQAPVELDLAKNLPPAFVDEVQIQQVILNLIRNALDALATRSQAKKGVQVSTEVTDNETIRVTVADHGVGMSPDTAARVFEPFFTSKPSGMGLGLSICSTIIRIHQGKLWYEPNEGGGSRFLFTLPAN